MSEEQDIWTAINETGEVGSVSSSKLNASSGLVKYLVIRRTLKYSTVLHSHRSLIYWTGRATFPRWLYRGPYWWRSVNAWWLSWWGWVFYR